MLYQDIRPAEETEAPGFPHQQRQKTVSRSDFKASAAIKRQRNFKFTDQRRRRDIQHVHLHASS
jgi:hypothetical protein